MLQIENRMVNDSVWERLEKKLSRPGYYNPCMDVFVAKEDALEYMIEILKADPDRADDVMEYFYANSFINYEMEEKENGRV